MARPRRQRKLFTVFADASWNPETGAAGYGVYIVSDDAPSIVQGGPLRTPMPDAQHAEMAALANAVYILTRVHDVADAAVLLQSDCIEVLSILRRQGYTSSVGKGTNLVTMRSTPAAPTYQPYVRMISTRLKSCRVFVRHVKGHTRDSKGRFHCNRECDRLAKEGRLKAEKQLKNVVPMKSKLA